MTEFETAIINRFDELTRAINQTNKSIKVLTEVTRGAEKEKEIKKEQEDIKAAFESAWCPKCANITHNNQLGYCQKCGFDKKGYHAKENL